MNIDKFISNEKLLEKELKKFFKFHKIKKIIPNKELVFAHLKKTKHNLEFFKLNKKNKGFNDWLIVSLYYALYHSALALIVNKNYSSKNHFATILLLIKEYSISKEEAELIDELSMNKHDAELYTSLMNERHNASYSTSMNLSNDKISGYEEKVIDFVNKAEAIIESSV